MKLKNFIFLNIVILVISILASIYLLTWRASLYQNFLSPGWENRDRISLRAPQIYFSWVLICSSIFSLYVGFQIFRQTKFKILGGGSFLTPAILLMIGITMLNGGIKFSPSHSSTWNSFIIVEIVLLTFVLFKIVQIGRKDSSKDLHDVLDAPTQ